MDIFSNQTSAEYLVCTKTSNTTTSNPIVGFSLYYEPTSVIAMLSDGSVVTMGIMSAALPPKTEDILLDQVEVQSPLKKVYIPSLLPKNSVKHMEISDAQRTFRPIYTKDFKERS